MLKGWVVGVTMLAVVAPAAAQAQREPSDVRTRQRISMMEAVLERAVLNGADNMLRQIRQQVGEPPMLSGPVQVRGHQLEGYGVLFDVGVPVLRMSIMWTVRQMAATPVAAAAPLADLREVALRLSPRDREQVEQLVRLLELQIDTAVRPSRTGIATLAAAGAAPPVAADAGRPPVAPVDATDDDPGEAYTREVKAALIEAMLENSSMIRVAPDEWLVVAARENMPRDPLMPGDYGEASTVQLRVLGSDLAAFREGRITFEEAQRRVIVREY